MPRQSISFTEPNDAWLNNQVDSQEYNSKSEVVNDLIRKARQLNDEIESIRAKLNRAEQSGFSERTPEKIRTETKLRLKNNAQL